MTVNETCSHGFILRGGGVRESEILRFFLTPLQIFNTSLAEPIPDGYEDVSNIVPPYSAFSAQGQPEVNHVKILF